MVYERAVAMFSRACLCVGLSVFFCNLPLLAEIPQQPAEGQGNKTVNAVLGCASVSQSDQRLACYDRAVADLRAATSKHDVVVIDRDQVRKTKRSLFGFSLPSFKLFGDESSGSSDVEDREITAKVQDAQRDGNGMWIIVLDDGATWHQTSGMIALRPRPGNAIQIKRGALGSYFLRVGSQPAVKAMREK